MRRGRPTAGSSTEPLTTLTTARTLCEARSAASVAAEMSLIQSLGRTSSMCERTGVEGPSADVGNSSSGRRRPPTTAGFLGDVGLYSKLGRLRVGWRRVRCVNQGDRNAVR